jgi:hypothetical protein
MRALIIVALSFVSMLAFSTFVKAQTGSALTSSVEWSPSSPGSPGWIAIVDL